LHEYSIKIVEVSSNARTEHACVCACVSVNLFTYASEHIEMASIFLVSYIIIEVNREIEIKNRA